MIALALASLLAATPAAAGAAICLPATPAAGPGVADPFRAPEPRATELNAAAKVLYRQGKWEEARAQYRAAEAADPTFLAPRLNVACSFVRQERFAEAVAEIRALIERAYVPWSREVLEAADLGALKVQPQMTEVRQVLGAAALAWGAGLEESVIFVGRMRPPLHVPPGSGEFILNPHQELFAFLPASGRFRQLTAEDGHVVAAARSADGRRVVYLTAQKLVRGEMSGLDTVAVRELTLATMTATAPVLVPGPVARVAVHATSRGLLFQIAGPRTGGWFALGGGGSLAPVAPARSGPPLAVLTAEGALPTGPAIVRGACTVTARDTPSASTRRVVTVSARGRPPQILGATYGAGLAGLPLP
jgi:hypothetical protein